jgi:hypothetical protein
MDKNSIIILNSLTCKKIKINLLIATIMIPWINVIE